MCATAPKSSDFGAVFLCSLCLDSHHISEKRNQVKLNSFLMKNDLITDDTPIAMLIVGPQKELWTLFGCIMENPTSVQPSDKEVMNLEELVRLMGCSKSTIYKLVHQGKIPFCKLDHGGRKLYFLRKDILDWFQSQRIPAIEQEDKKCARKLCRR